MLALLVLCCFYLLILTLHDRKANVHLIGSSQVPEYRAEVNPENLYVWMCMLCIYMGM